MAPVVLSHHRLHQLPGLPQVHLAQVEPGQGQGLELHQEVKPEQLVQPAQPAQLVQPAQSVVSYMIA
jgi:hypothetical protein